MSSPSLDTTDAEPLDIDPAVFDKQNPVKAAMELFRSLIDEMDDLRENLRAAGLPLRTTRMIVELGVQGQHDKRAEALVAAAPNVAEVFTPEALTARIDRLVQLEKGYSEARAIARERDLDVQVLGMLTQIVQQNPGDRGQKLVATFIAYALACEIPLDDIAEVQQAVSQKASSVLPRIDRKALERPHLGKRQLVIDVLVGCLFAAGSLWLIAG